MIFTTPHTPHPTPHTPHLPSLWDSQGILWCGGDVSYSKKARNMAVMSYNRNF
ncbi:MAG: hypothetical protein F6K44_34665 [Moorea sp. SIO3E2]|nr:hypothetical protein [Moorena sp. SIO3E2]